VRHDPAGVVAIVTPWNSPLMLTTEARSALAAGNTVIVKPPEWAPLTCSLLAEAAHAAGIPPGVFNVVQGSGATTGARLVSDPRLARISFTGSVPTAKWIAQTAGANLVPCSLELGGKSPFIVLADADLDGAAATAALMYRNAGQVCLAGTRLLVDRRIAEFVARMRGYVDKLNIGDPREDATETARSSTRDRSSASRGLLQEPWLREPVSSGAASRILSARSTFDRRCRATSRRMPRSSRPKSSVRC
jgi:5-carboxymethyl-2-hydroxymuconic-semialdehyde dehydrogenase